MAKTYTVQDITDLSFNSFNVTRDPNGAVFVIANVSGTLTNPLDSTDTKQFNIPISVLASTLGIGPQLVAIRAAILAFAKTKL